MDETGYLGEGQIYCSVQNEKGGLVLTGQVVITRCPALHPGDLQYVDAVDVPQGSPLRSVHNCVVFSSKGDRDLPSQLSGGDLDGDLYNVIYDDTLMPTKTSAPADYPTMQAIDIGREVTRADMTDFFVQFMENDQLGRLSTLHQTLADQKEQGVFDPDCILLAEMCSTAVDFSKTGIPVKSLLDRSFRADDSPRLISGRCRNLATSSPTSKLPGRGCLSRTPSSLKRWKYKTMTRTRTCPGR